MRALWTAIGTFALAAVASPAFANNVPEPGVLELAGLGIAVAVAAHWARNRRK